MSRGSRLGSVSLAALVVLGLAACKTPPKPPAQPVPQAKSGVVRLSSALRKAIGVQTVRVSARTLPRSLDALGDVAARPEGEAVVHAPFEGLLVELRATVGEHVRRGQVLALIRSAELGRAQSAYLKALGEQRLAQRERQRQHRLFADHLASRREVDEATQKDDAARVALAQAMEELRVYGIEPQAIAALATRGRVDPLQALTSPATGTITRRMALKGARVAPNDEEPLFSLLDLSVVRIETDIPERAWQFVRAGQTARVEVDALPHTPVSGRVIRVAPLLNPESHTGKALIDIPNPKEALRPGMSARVHIQTGTQSLLTVPSAAIAQEGELSFVYRALPDGDFAETRVKSGARVGDWVPIIQGLSPGDQVVTKGAFELHSEARKSSFGGE